MIPKKPTEIFSYICHFIFAIIIANSYDVAAKIFINPAQSFLSDFNSLTSAFELSLAYVIIISGWVGYSRSMIKWPHTNTTFGTLRFSLDLAILFCYFVLISSVGSQNTFREYFLSWIIVLFALFFVWDLFKIKEYYKKDNNNKFNDALAKSCMMTIVFLIIFNVVRYLFNFLLENQVGVITDDIIYWFVLLLVALLMLIYRYWKWSIPPRRRSVKNNTNSKKKLIRSDNSSLK